MEYFNDCIAAISTPAGSGGIAIIRISGESAFLIADKMFSATKEGVLSHYVSKMPDHTIRHGYIFDFAAGAELIDECLLSKMEAPRTYTAENVVEINCHGGFAVASSILRLALRLGARAAEPGEFTKRAFLNGRIDLAEAEGVMDIINARTEESRKAAARQLSGRLTEQIERICDSLVKALSEIEVSIDYPEYEMDDETGEDAFAVIEQAEKELTTLGATYERGRLIRDGLRLVIAGRPNAGKSSLMNILTGYNRSIVTDIPGTTRDTVDELIQIGGIPILVTDTAGLRDTDDAVEKIGVGRALEKLRDADFVVYVADCRDFLCGGADRHDAMLIDKEKSLIVINKIDIDPGGAAEAAERFFQGFLCLKTSLLHRDGADMIFELIRERCLGGNVNFGSENIITNERHKQLIDSAIKLLQNSRESYSAGMPLDCVSYDVRLCTEMLGGIIGRNISDDVIHDIFSRFCLGK